MEGLQSHSTYEGLKCKNTDPNRFRGTLDR